MSDTIEFGKLVTEVKETMGVILYISPISLIAITPFKSLTLIQSNLGKLKCVRH